MVWSRGVFLETSTPLDITEQNFSFLQQGPKMSHSIKYFDINKWSVCLDSCLPNSKGKSLHLATLAPFQHHLDAHASE